MFIAATWGTRQLVETRSIGPVEENSWTFGQIFPLILVAAPLATMVQNFSEAGRHLDSTNTTHPDGTPRLSADRNAPDVPPTVDQDPIALATSTQPGNNSRFPFHRQIQVAVLDVDPLHSGDPGEVAQQLYIAYTEKSLMFQGNLTFIIVSYFATAIYVVFYNPRGFIIPLKSIAIILLTMTPFTQAIWILFIMLKPPRTYHIPNRRRERIIALGIIVYGSIASAGAVLVVVQP